MKYKLAAFVFWLSERVEDLAWFIEGDTRLKYTGRGRSKED